MTDETTARDRAIEMAERLEWTATNATGYAGLERGYAGLELVAREAVEVLRALAAAPTGDVAALPTPEDVAAEMSRRMVGSDTVARRQSLLDPACRALDAVRALRPAAPEGVDAADEQGDDLIRRATKYHHAHLRAHGDEQAAMAATLHVFNLHRAPEGVDAADELRIAREQYSSTLAELERVLDSREQVYRERDEACTQRTAAQGELHRRNVEAKSATIRAAGLADDLAAAQAAIQRVRAECDGAEKRAHDMVGIFSGKKGAEVPAWVGKIRRALDGDATEES